MRKPSVTCKITFTMQPELATTSEHETRPLEWGVIAWIGVHSRFKNQDPHWGIQ